MMIFGWQGLAVRENNPRNMLASSPCCLPPGGLQTVYWVFCVFLVFFETISFSRVVLPESVRIADNAADRDTEKESGNTTSSYAKF